MRRVANGKCRSSLVFLSMSISLIAGVAIVTALPAGAAPNWSIAATQNPSAATGTHLSRVSCPSTKSCFAVGYFMRGSTSTRLLEHWNGSSWGIMSSPLPSGATDTALSAIACPAIRSCFAVGHSYFAVGEKTLVLHWDGRSWSIMPSPNPSDATFSQLRSISCPSPGSCFALGSRFTDPSVQKALVEHWNGTQWGIMPIPNPSGTTVTGLADVSCPALRSCFAAGFGYTGLGDNTLVEHWNGTNWTIMATPNATGSNVTDLNGIACPSSRSCFAVGGHSVGLNGFLSVVEHWNGTSWSLMASPDPSGATVNDLLGVACPSTKSCFAAGYQTNNGVRQTIVEHWNGTQWGIMETPDPKGTTIALLAGVSCASTKVCFAVGESAVSMVTPSLSLAERYS